ncbi:hypothetical protein C9374_002174 [Naegleria lovaniensis]|uniref:Uncharacterized protein n=1 Tax=Naegleria lovaniensis TaxID=51637 RepID=A0AA88GWR6_NAELO|nr:uncharacterized protein C9374_002174 [Naegleria lovaniensis]KAG2387139.1 hypothetical protein C9374_002174 [Naegleria lovaniensis]
MFKPKQTFRSMMINRTSSWKSYTEILNTNIISKRYISTQTTSQLIRHFKKHHQHRGFIVFSNSTTDSPDQEPYKLSHPCMEPVLEYISSQQQTAMSSVGKVEKGTGNMEALFLEVSPVTQSLLGCFIHNTKRGLALGSIDLWHYPHASEFVNAGLVQSANAARRMALTNQYWGGGKAIIQTNPDFTLNYSNPEVRRTIMNELGSFISSLRGVVYVDGGFGINSHDMVHVFERTRFTTFTPKLSMNGNLTAQSQAKTTIAALEGAMSLRTGSEDLSDCIVALQGIKHNFETCKLLLQKKVGKIILTDTDPIVIKNAKSIFNREIIDGRVEVRLVFEDQDSILHLDNVDMLVPSSGIKLNAQNISDIKASIICGVSLSQFESIDLEKNLRKDQDVIIIPSLVIESSSSIVRGNEVYGFIPEIESDPEINKYFSPQYDFSFFNLVRRMITLSKEKDLSTEQCAVEIADEIMKQPHPFIPSRGSQIIQSLIKDEWNNADF